ncbi:hypothetical protein Y034_1180 [Burkholderia pseudomallei MSHR449]|nr:hypothetical protein Y034_1180 [Burkholderia pseudomallei MSHR449]
MAAVLVILAPEQRRRFVQPRRVQRAQILGQAIDLLIDVRPHELEHAVGLELVPLLPAVHVHEAAEIGLAPYVLRERGFEPQRAADHVAAAFQIAVAERQEIERPPLERVPRQPAVRAECRRQHVRLEEQRRAMVRARAKRFRQAGEADRRLEPFAVRPALDVIENLGPVHDGRRIVEREDLGARRRSDLARPVPQSRCRGTGDVRARGRRRRRRAAAPRRQSAENPLPFDSSITTRPAPAIPHRKKRECRRSSHLVRHPTYPMSECGATHAPCHAQRPPRRSGRELASHIPPARRRALSRSPSTPREAPRVPLRTGVLCFRPLRNEPSKKDSQ